jgi:hypothetical protein
MVVFAIQRVPSAERIVVPKPNLQVEAEPLKKQDRVREIQIARPVVASTEPVPVKTERIVLDPPESKVPPVLVVDDEPTPVKRTRARVADRGDVCTRHHMRKVITRGGKSWRCRR